MATSGSKFSPFTTIWSQGSKSRHQVWWQVPLLAERSDGSGSMVMCVRARAQVGVFLSCSPPPQAEAPRQAGRWLCTVPSYCCSSDSKCCLWKTPLATSVYTGNQDGSWEATGSCAPFHCYKGRALVFSPRAHLSLWKTLESDGILFCITVSLFLNSVALSVLSTSFPTPNPNLPKTAYFLAWIFRHSLFLQSQNFHLFLFSSHYSGKFPWQREERTTLPFSNIFLTFSTPKPNALKYFDSKSIILIRKPRQWGTREHFRSYYLRFHCGQKHPVMWKPMPCFFFPVHRNQPLCPPPPQHFKSDSRTGKVAQKLWALAVLAEDPNLVLSTPIRQLEISYNSSSRGSHTFWPQWAAALVCTHIHYRHTHGHMIKNKIKQNLSSKASPSLQM